LFAVSRPINEQVATGDASNIQGITIMTILSALIQTYMAWKRFRAEQQHPVEQ
jgi:hypothetical protein